ncbi:hypothetical protein SEA_BETTERKATZ_72 [Gordonia phage BetterKatz]|uniref:DUF4326 domain-containing protein n=1 Tax=Gordonia phage BetterKatz TaxID=1821551 RepID=A0A142KC74_9CAUD|nr:hypothetical protein BJD67_gp72 [Gordonia phage BetterKatz]AMS03707.1 hypothetical protein SEA_BETTERKATZ_72 [Gordonia phage BetterKatz]
MTPTRIQRRRTKGWRMPDGAIYVGRPTKWGNPFRPVFGDGEWWAQDENDVRYPLLFNNRDEALRKCVSLYWCELVQWTENRFRLPELSGHDLACWCPLDQPCHADVLLELANHEGTADDPQH